MALNQNIIQALVKADMYTAYIPGGFTCNLLGENTLGDLPPREYFGDDSSTATDDGENIINPTGHTGAGRWIKCPGQKRIETYFGATDSSGNFTVSYAIGYDSIPEITPQLQAGSNTQLIKITSSTASGFTVNVQNRSDVLGLLPSYAAVSGASVSILVTSR